MASNNSKNNLNNYLGNYDGINFSPSSEDFSFLK